MTLRRLPRTIEGSMGGGVAAEPRTYGVIGGGGLVLAKGAGVALKAAAALDGGAAGELPTAVGLEGCSELAAAAEAGAASNWLSNRFGTRGRESQDSTAASTMQTRSQQAVFAAG